MSRALIIVAHGSSVNPNSARTVEDAARALAERDEIRARFDAVRARFLKQAPRIEEEAWDADECVVVPFFMADGYFVDKVLPGHLPAHARRTPPLGTADLSGAVVRTVQRFDPTAHLVLVGHGTERSPDSAATVEELARRLRSELASVTTAFVDQHPRLQTTWERVPDDGAPVVVLPYFAFAGPHTDEDIPDGLGLASAGVGPHEVASHLVFYAPPIGTAPEVVDALAHLALRG